MMLVLRVKRAKVSVSIDEWLRNGNGIEEKDLAAWEERPENPDTWSTFHIQVNEFEGGGVAIGINCSHMNADPTSLLLLFKTWTEVHRRQDIAHPLDFSPASALHGRAVTSTNTKADKYYVTKSIAQAPSMKMASTTFKFSNSAIKQCLSEEVCVKCPDATPFDRLAALFWMRIARLKSSKDEHNKLSMSICIDFRRLLKEPLPLGYFGNALYFSQLTLEEKEVISGDLGNVVVNVHGHVAGIKKEEILSMMDWFESRKGDKGKYKPPFRMYGPELTFVNMEHMMNEDENESLMYGAIFEDQMKPAHVACHVGNAEGEGLIMMMPSAEEGLARTVILILPEEEMVELCEDEAILSLEPTMILSGGL